MAGGSKTEQVVLTLGSNSGDRLAALRAAAAGLAPYVKIAAISPVYEGPAIYVTDQPAFLNAAVLGETALEPPVLLRALKTLEYELGRQPTFRYGPRLIALDIIFYGARIVNAPELSIPHPRLEEREFVLRPLADIAPDWKHPQNGKTVAEMLARISPVGLHLLGPLLESDISCQSRRSAS